MDLLNSILTDAASHPISRVAFVVIVASTTQLIFRHSIGRIVRKVVRSHHYPTALEEKQREQTLASIFRTASSVIIWTVATISLLFALKIDVGPLLTGAGLIGVIVGFGAQSTIKDFLSGIYIILEDQYRVGNWVTLNDVSGEVEDITIRITRLRDFDGSLHIVPNGQVELITNHTTKIAHVVIEVGVSYDADIKKVEDAMNKAGKAMTESKKWQEKMVEPIQFIRVDSFGDSAVNVLAFGKVKPGSQWEVAGEFRLRMKQEFDKNKIEIPFPQRVIHQAKKGR